MFRITVLGLKSVFIHSGESRSNNNIGDLILQPYPRSKASEDSPDESVRQPKFGCVCFTVSSISEAGTSIGASDLS